MRPWRGRTGPSGPSYAFRVAVAVCGVLAASSGVLATHAGDLVAHGAPVDDVRANTDFRFRLWATELGTATLANVDTANVTVWSGNGTGQVPEAGTVVSSQYGGAAGSQWFEVVLNLEPGWYSLNAEVHANETGTPGNEALAFETTFHVPEGEEVFMLDGMTLGETTGLLLLFGVMLLAMYRNWGFVAAVALWGVIDQLWGGFELFSWRWYWLFVAIALATTFLAWRGLEFGIEVERSR